MSRGKKQTKRKTVRRKARTKKVAERKPQASDEAKAESHSTRRGQEWKPDKHQVCNIMAESRSETVRKKTL